MSVQQADLMVACAKQFPRCLHQASGPVAYAVPALACACHVYREGQLSNEPVYVLRLLPEVRDAVEEYARQQNIPATVAIAEACRAYCVGSSG